MLNRNNIRTLGELQTGIFPFKQLPSKIEMTLREDGITYDIKMSAKFHKNNNEIIDGEICVIGRFPYEIELYTENNNALFSIVFDEVQDEINK